MLTLIFAALAQTAAAAAAPVVDCRFDVVKLEFAGDAQAQARCLLRPVRFGGGSSAEQPLPATLATLVGQPAEVDEKKLATALRRARFTLPSSTPVSETSDHRRALYFVIHDTSSPWIDAPQFPKRFNVQRRFNDVREYLGKDAVAHVFNNRRGQVTVGHDFEVGWRATKLERLVGVIVRGRFLHVENVQPRRADEAGPARNDLIAPDPGFTSAQYRSLALLYVLASARAHIWLIPAFHANIDRGIPKAHDDPQHFNLAVFDRELGHWRAKLGSGLIDRARR